MSAQHTPGPLDKTQKLCDRAKRCLEQMEARIGELSRMPGGRAAMSHAERVEFDILGSTLSTIEMRSRAVYRKATGEHS